MSSPITAVLIHRWPGRSRVALETSIVAAITLLTVSFTRADNGVRGVATFRNDAAHKSDAERCLQILSEAGIKPATTGGFFAVVTVSEPEADRARKLLGGAIEHGGLHVRLTKPPLPLNRYEGVAWYYDKDEADGKRAYVILHEHGIQELGGSGNAGTASIDTLPEKAAEARRFLAQAIKTEGLRVNILPAEEQDESPGALFFVRHLTIPADQSPDGRAMTRLVVFKNIEMEPLTFSAQQVWTGELPVAEVTKAWSPDARYFIFAGDPAGDSTRLFYVDVTAEKPLTTELNLRDIAPGEKTAKSKETLKYHTDLKGVTWSGTNVAKLEFAREDGNERIVQTLSIDLAATPPGLHLERSRDLTRR